MLSGIYRARCTQVQTGHIKAFVPQVFGDTEIIISDFLTGTLPTPGPGWVGFISGDPEHPVWLSVDMPETEGFITARGYWNYSTQTAAPPSSGQVRWNGSDTLYIHKSDADGFERDLSSAVESGRVITVKSATGGKYTFTATGTTVDDTTHWSVPVSNAAGSNTPNNNTRIELSVQIPSGGVVVGYLPLSGGTLSGALNFGGNDLQVIRNSSGTNIDGVDELRLALPGDTSSPTFRFISDSSEVYSVLVAANHSGLFSNSYGTAENGGEAIRLDGNVPAVFLEVDGEQLVSVNNSNNLLRLLPTNGATRPYLAIYGGTDGDRKMYVGYPDLTTDEVSVSADTGNLRLQAANSSIRLNAGNGEVKDISERQFLRTGSDRGSPQLIQYGKVTGSTDANGDHTIVFPEAFTSEPSVTANYVGAATYGRTINVHTVSTTGCKFRVHVSTTGAAEANLSRTVYWMAAGPKTNV